MANHTIYVSSGEVSASFYRFDEWIGLTGQETHQNEEGRFTFNIPNIAGATIRSVSISAPVQDTKSQGGYGDFNLKIGSQTVNSWVDSDTTSWGASGLGIAGKQSETITLELKPSSNLHKKYWGEQGSWDSYTGRTFGRATAAIVIEGEFTESNVFPISGDSIPKSLENTFTWSPNIILGSIVRQSLFWKKLEDSTYNEVSVGAADTTYTFPPFTFDNGNINWYVQGVDSSGNVANSPVETVTVGIVPSELNIAYPNDVNIRNSNIQIFTWELVEAISTGQKSYEIQYKGATEDSWHTVIEESENQYHEFAPNTFITDDYEWKLRVTNNDDITTEFTSATFVSIGSTNAPNIVNITNSSIPTITWEIPSQDTFEMEIYDSNGRVYSSGVCVGSDIRSFTPNIMLEDGNYIVKMRAMNEYGYFTQWSDYSFVLAPPKPQTVECMAYANSFHGINVMLGSGNPSRLYVLRREYGQESWQMLGRLVAGQIYVDNTVLTGQKYEYALRNYEPNAGFTDSNVVSMVIDYKGSLIYDQNDFVQLYKTEDEQFNITHTPSKAFSYSYTIGRKYPVRESSEWISHTTSLSCFVTFEDYKMLERFYESNDDLWFKGKDFSFKCSIDNIQIAETLLGKGYSISIDLSRTDENEVNLLE